MDKIWSDGCHPRRRHLIRYCDANDFDITPEADGGAGPVDFKISKGYQYRVVVEMKLSSNSNLVHGFEVQLPEYQKAEKGAPQRLLGSEER